MGDEPSQMMFRLLLLLLGAAVFADAYDGPIKFKLDRNEEDRFVFAPVAFISNLVFSADSSICLNLTTSAPVNISFGSCLESTYVGTFGNGSVQLTKARIDEAMEKARGDAVHCHRKPVGIFLAANEEPAKGVFNLFKCVPSSVRSQHNDEIIETPVMDSAVNTWNDRRRDIAFNVVGTEVWTARVGLARAVDFAINNEKTHTLCLAINGVPMANVTFAKCRRQGGFNAFIKNGTNFGLRANLWHMRQEKCPADDETKDTDWWIKVNSMNGDAISGHVSVFSCREHKKSDGKHYISSTYTPNYEYMGFDKVFAFAQGAIQETVYSADIMEIVNTAAFNDPGLFTVQMTVQTLAPVSISLSRCRHSEPEDRVLIVAHQSAGIVLIEDLRKIVNLSRLPKCGTYESDEALYLRVRSNKKTVGSVKFSLKYSDGNDGALIRSKPVFKVPKGGYIVREYPLGNIFDKAMTNHLPLGIILETTSNVTISVSKCANSRRYILVDNEGSGTLRFSWRQIIAAVNDFVEVTCPDAELFQADNLYIRIEAPFGEAIGSMQIASLMVNHTRSNRTPFIDVNSFFKAVDHQQLIRLVKPNDTLTNIVAEFETYPQEIDIRFFVETVLIKPEWSLFFETDRPVNLILNRCLNNTADGFKITATPNTPLTRDDVIGLKVMMRTRRCDNQALNGLFVHLADKDYTGMIEIYIVENFDPFPKKMLTMEDLMKMGNIQVQ